MIQFWVFFLIQVTISYFVVASSSTECRWNPEGPLSPKARTRCPLTLGNVDNEHGSVEPWTHRLRCIYAKQPPSNDSKPAYCLFTDFSFRGNRGLSIITSPDTAADIVASDALEDVEDSWLWEKRVFNPGPVANKNGPSYEVEDIPGKGKGVIARRKIEQGEIFMLDYPALLVQREFVQNMGPDYRQKFLMAAMGQLPEDAQEKLLSLARSKGGTANIAEDIMTTNACGIVVADTQPHMGLFPEVSRMNHDCSPNAFYRFSQRALTMEVVAYRNIQPGEEININYAYLGMPYHVRQDFLRKTWGFRCSCSLCRSSITEKQKSDDRRMQIVQARNDMKDAHQNGEIGQAIHNANKLLELSKVEGLNPLMAEFYEILATLYLEMRDVANARFYGQQALDHWLKFNSVDSFHVEVNRAFMREVERAEVERG